MSLRRPIPDTPASTAPPHAPAHPPHAHPASVVPPTDPATLRTLSDEDLIARASHHACTVASRHAIFEVLFTRYRDWAYALALRITGSHDLALDAVQDAFLYFARKLPSLNLSAKLTTFLYPAVKHCALAARRKAARFAISHDPRPADDAPSHPSHTHEPAAPEPATFDLPPESLATFRSAWDTLSDAHREVLVMRFVAEMTVPEIAAALNTAEGTIKSRLHHACHAFQT